MWITKFGGMADLVVLCGMVKIYTTDSYYEIAKKIYNDFEVGASCVIMGFIEDEANKRLIQKGQAVIDAITLMYEDEFMHSNADKKFRRYKYKKDSIGGPIAHKIFTFDKKIINNEPRYIIWRYQ